MGEGEKPSYGYSSRVKIGAMMSSILGVAFGMGLIVAGSFMTWSSDGVLGLFSQSGWAYGNVVAGDGKVTFAIGVLGFCCLLAGAIARRSVYYAAAVALSAAAFVLVVYELAVIASGPGLSGPGNGIYMIFGGCVPAFMCSLTGYLMLREEQEYQSDGRDTLKVSSGGDPVG